MAVTRQRTVVLTIHQPSYRILETTNRFLVMAKGNVIFHGEIHGIIKHFHGLGHPLPEHVSNSATAIIIVFYRALLFIQISQRRGCRLETDALCIGGCR